MNYTKIQKDFQTMTKDTQKLVDQYNKSVQSIKSQELAIENLRNKINAIKNGDVVPSSIQKMESQLAKNNRELEKTEIRINELKNKKVTTIIEDEELAKLKQAQVDLVQINSELTNEIKQARSSSLEVQELNSKLELLNSKLQDTKDKTNELGNAIENSMNQNHIKLFGGKIDEVGKKVDKFKTKISRLIGSAMIFSLIRNQLTSLRNGFISLLKADDQFASSLNQVKANLMTAFAPIYNSCLPAINSLMSAVSKVTGTIAVFVSSLFGQSIKDTTKQAKKLSGALNDTAKSGEKAAGSLGSFDNLEVIQETSASAGGGSSSSGIDYNGEITYSEKLLGVLNKIKEVLSPIINFIKNFQEEHGTLATAILVVAGALAGLLIIKTIKKLFTGVGGAVKGVTADFTGFFDGLGKAATAIAVLGGLALVIESITGLIDAFSESGMTLGEVAGLLGIILGELVLAFVAFLGAMTLMKPGWESIAAAAVIFAGLAVVLLSVNELIKTCSENGIELSEIGTLLGEMFLVIVGLMASIAVLGPLMSAGLVPFSILMAEISAVLIVMALTLPTILDAVGGFIEQTAPSLCLILTTIGNLIQGIIVAVGETLPPIINSLGNVFNTVFNGISKVINSVGNVIINIMKTADSLVNSVLSAIIKFINKLGPAINNFVDNAIKAVTKLINFIVSGIEYLVNTLIVAGVNKIIKSINSISKYVGINIPTVSNMAIPRFVPKLATGAVIPPRQEFMAILGDQKHGTNIEAPLETIKQANREVLSEFLSNAGINNQDREIVLKNWQFILQLGNNNSFAKMVIDEVKKYEKETNTQFLLA